MNAIAQLGHGHVFHSRTEGGKHSFRYPTFFLYFDCSQEAELRQILRRRFYRWLSVQPKDYLCAHRESFLTNIKNYLKETCQYEAEDVWLQTLPRMFGYAFNPVSFWFCRRQGRLEAVLVEVNNTFGERHCYWIYPDKEIDSNSWYRTEKVFHVSPFFPVEGYYQFRFQLLAGKNRVDIHYYSSKGQLRLATWITGELSDVSASSVLYLLGRYGWITPLVLIRIHYQALRIWLKKNRFYSKPAPPRQEVSS